MSKYAYDGIIQLWYAATIADQDSPAVTELDVDLTPFLRALDTPFGGSTVDAGTADDRYNSTVAGTYGGQPVTATFTRDRVYGDDDAYTTLAFGTTGFWVVAWRGGSSGESSSGAGDGELAAGDRVDVIPIEVLSRNPVPYGRNVLASLTVECSVPNPPSQDVVLTAS